MIRVHETAHGFLASCRPATFDLVFTSPPAYPSPRQPTGMLGTEATVGDYAEALTRVLWRAARALRRSGFLVVVLEPIPGFDVMAAMAPRLRRSMALFRLLGTYRWSHGEGEGSWVLFLGRGRGARLNRRHAAWRCREWAIPRPPPDAAYGFYEWPDGLVEAVVGLTIPGGGRVLDPFAGKASALSRLGPEYEVVAVDVMNFASAIGNAGEGTVGLAHPVRAGCDVADGAAGSAGGGA